MRISASQQPRQRGTAGAPAGAPEGKASAAPASGATPDVAPAPTPDVAAAVSDEAPALTPDAAPAPAPDAAAVSGGEAEWVSAQGRVERAAALLAQVRGLLSEDQITDGELTELAAAIHGLTQRAQALHAAVVGQVLSSGMWGVEGQVSAQGWLRASHRLDGRAASRTKATARWLAEYPHIAEAFEAGRILNDHVQVMRRIGAATPPRREAFGEVAEAMVAVAQAVDAERLAQVMRAWAEAVDAQGANEQAEVDHERRGLFLSPVGDGWDLRGWLPAALGAELAGVLNEVMAASRRLQPDVVADPTPTRRADALIEVARTAASAALNPAARQRAAVQVLVPLGPLRRCPACRDALADTLLGHYLPPSPTDTDSGQGGLPKSNMVTGPPRYGGRAERGGPAQRAAAEGPTDPAERAGPADDADPAERAGPADDAGPAERAGPADDAGPAERAGLADDAGPAERAGLADDADPAKRAGPDFGPGRAILGSGPPDDSPPGSCAESGASKWSAGEPGGQLPPVIGAMWRTGNGPGEGFLAGVEVDRLACDPVIRRVVLSPQSAVLDVGRSTRVIPAALRAALEVRDGGCVIPGCARPPGWCEAHHLIPWSQGGESALSNLALLCSAHHHKLHLGHWRVTLDLNGRPHVQRPVSHPRPVHTV